MKIRTEAGTTETKEVKIVVVYIGENRYRLSENHGNLSIIKSSDGISNKLGVFPINSSEIEIF